MGRHTDEEETIEVKYPAKIVPKSWDEFASRAKSILLQHGRYVDQYGDEGKLRVFVYSDEFMTIKYHRMHWGKKQGYFEVMRKRMPGHPSGSYVHTTTNPVYMEVGGKCLRVHGEASYIYQHILDLTGG